MKKISNQRLPHKMGAFTTLNNTIHDAITARSSIMVEMSGYPVASHAVGRIQQQLDLSSMRALLSSVKRLRDLVKLASDVLQTIPLAKVDRQQMVRVELIAYIQSMSSSYGVKLADDLEADFVAYLITSSETSDTAWILDFSTKDNRIVNFHRLYLSLLDSSAPSVDTKLSLSMDKTRESDFIYEPESEEIKHFSETRRLKKLIADAKASSKLRKTVTDKSELSNEVIDAVTNAQTVMHLSHIRVVDHLFALLMDINVWKNFISPRSKTDVAQNQERAKSLKMFAAYLHSLLMYHQFFSIELFLGTYHQLSKWLVALPSIPAHVQAEYDDIIRKHDVLGVQADVQQLLGDWDQSQNSLTKGEVINIPYEVSGFFGLYDVQVKVESALTEQITPIPITSLKELDSPEYNYLMLAHPVTNVEMISDFTNSILLSHIVTEQIAQASAGIVPGIPKFLSEDMIKSLSSVAPRLPFPLAPSLVINDEVERATNAVVSHGKFDFRRFTPARTYDYQLYLRRTINFSIIKSSTITSVDADVLPVTIFNLDAAAKLRLQLGHEWRSLIPSFISYSELTYASSDITGSKEMTRRLLETLTGQHYELITRTIGNPYLQNIWATYLSSFALLYVTPRTIDVSSLFSATEKGSSAVAEASLGAYLVEGYGQPYGTSYTSLASKQPAATLADFFEIVPGVMLRVLRQIPLPTEKLEAAEDFYMQHPYYYFPSNSIMKKVDNWSMADGLLNFCMTPILGENIKPLALLDKQYAYINDSLMMQTDITYTVSPSANEGPDFSLHLVTKPWHHDRFVHFIEYITMGTYTKDTESDSVNTDEASSKLISDMEKEMKRTEAESSVARIDDADPSIVDKNFAIETKTERVTNFVDNQDHGSKPTNKDSGKKKKKKKSSGEHHSDDTVTHIHIDKSDGKHTVTEDYTKKSKEKDEDEEAN